MPFVQLRRGRRGRIAEADNPETGQEEWKLQQRVSSPAPSSRSRTSTVAHLVRAGTLSYRHRVEQISLLRCLSLGALVVGRGEGRGASLERAAYGHATDSSRRPKLPRGKLCSPGRLFIGCV
ncbi:hypothetical protein MRX96_040887 [Rhipicephalus microplus]